MLRRGRRRSGANAVAEPTFGPDWDVPPTFNFARDVIDGHGDESFRRAMTYVGADGTIDRRTFRDLARDSVRWCHLLEASDPAPGARVLIALDTSSAWVGAIVGAIRCGLVPVPVEPNLDASELARRAEAVDASIVVINGLVSPPALRRALSRVSVAPVVVTLEEAEWELLRAFPQRPFRDPSSDTPAVILFTRGRTAFPEPVVHSHASTFAARATTHAWLGARPGDVVCCGTHAGTIAAVWLTIFGPLAIGAEVLIVGSEVEPDERALMLERFAPTILVDTPSGHARLLELLERDGTRLPRLRLAGSTGARLDTSLAERFRAVTGAPLLNAYTTTEMGTILAQTPGSNSPPGSVGDPLPGHTVWPIDEGGAVVAPGTGGDLALYGRPPSLFRGYWPDVLPIDAAEEGWWSLTGDRGSYDEQGTFWLDTEPVARADHDESSQSLGSGRRTA